MTVLRNAGISFIVIICLIIALLLLFNQEYGVGSLYILIAILTMHLYTSSYGVRIK